MKLVLPNKTYKEKYEKLIKYWWKIEDLWEMSPWNLFNWNNFEEFLESTILYRNNSPTWVNSTLYFLIDNWEIIWGIDIRHTIENSVLKEFWWHIWYWIFPEYRKKWYWVKILQLGLEKVKELWLNKILICCEKNNRKKFRSFWKIIKVWRT